MKKIWKVNKKAPQAFLNKFPEYSRLTLQLLWDRGLKTQKAVDEFFNPDYTDLHNPFLLKDLKKAIGRIEKAVDEKVAVFADYDADGVCAGTILYEVLKIFKIKPEIYIPDRHIEGYGLNIEAVKKLADKGISLIITVDCGVTDLEEVRLANKLGIDVLIFDHHEIPDKLPPAYAVVNPKQKSCKYPFKHLSAAGVAFKLAQAVADIKKLDPSWEKWLLDLVAISTCADSMLLLGENRILVKYGLIVLSQTRRIGLEALIKTARISKEKLNTYTLGFVLAPRINAASRIDHGSLAYRLLVCSDEKKALEIAESLEEKNRKRQQLTYKIFKEAKQRGCSGKIVFQGDKDWPAGIAGLIAQKLMEEFYRPAFVYQELKDFSAGSVRSVPEFNAVRAMNGCKKVLLEHGGHPMAAGFKVLNDKVKDFKDLLEKQALKQLKGKKLVPCLNIDAEVDDLDWDCFEQIEKFDPFGMGNWNPLFLMKDLKVLSIRKVGSNGGHLKMYLEKKKKFDAIGFGLGDYCAKINTGDKISVVFELIANEWNGNRELQLKVIDLK